MGRRALYGAIVLGIFLCLAPIWGIVWSSGYAERHGCTLHEGFVTPCIVDGHDYGPALYSAFVSGWFLLAGLPLAVILLALLTRMFIPDVIKWIKQRRTP